MRLWMAATLLVIGLVLGPLPASAAEKITLGYTPGPDFLAAFTAQDQGFFAKHGIDMKLQFTPSAQSIPPALLADSLQIGTPTVPIFVLAAASGLPLKIIGGNIQTGDNFHLSAIIVRSDVQAAGPKDLEGKTIAVPGIYSFMHILLVKWLQTHGVEVAKVHMVEVPIPGMMDALKTAQVDAVVPVDPFMSRIVGAGVGRILSYYIDDFPPGILPTIYVATAAYIEKHREAIEGVHAALAEGLAWHQAHPEGAPASLAKYMNVTPEIAKNLPLPHFITDVSPQQVQFWADLMTEQKILTEPVDVKALLVR